MTAGDIELVDVVGNRVLVATRGACASCQSSNMTLKNFVEVKLRELVAPELVVEEVARVKIVYLDKQCNDPRSLRKFWRPCFLISMICMENPSSMHSFGGQSMKELRKARERMADLLGRITR